MWTSLAKTSTWPMQVLVTIVLSNAENPLFVYLSIFRPFLHVGLKKWLIAGKFGQTNFAASSVYLFDLYILQFVQSNDSSTGRLIGWLTDLWFHRTDFAGRHGVLHGHILSPTRGKQTIIRETTLFITSPNTRSLGQPKWVKFLEKRIGRHKETVFSTAFYFNPKIKVI